MFETEQADTLVPGTSQTNITSEAKSETSDEDVPLIKLQDRLRKHKRIVRKQRRIIHENIGSSDDNDSDIDKTYVPSDNISTDDSTYDTPTVEKRKRKWVRKRIRPLKREEGRKYAKKIKVHKMVQCSSDERMSDHDFKEAVKRSKLENNVNATLKRFGESRLTRLISSNGLERQPIQPDGNCVLNAVIHQASLQELSVSDLRTKLCEHLFENEQHYSGYVARTVGTEHSSHNYKKMVNALQKDGVWNTEMSDVLPLATANFFKKNVTIFTSKLNNPIVHVTPDLHEASASETTNITLSYMAVRGFEHYDSCVKSHNQNKDTTPDISKTKSTSVDSSQEAYQTSKFQD